MALFMFAQVPEFNQRTRDCLILGLEDSGNPEFAFTSVQNLRLEGWR